MWNSNFDPGLNLLRNILYKLEQKWEWNTSLYSGTKISLKHNTLSKIIMNVKHKLVCWDRNNNEACYIHWNDNEC